MSWDLQKNAFCSLMADRLERERDMGLAKRSLWVWQEEHMSDSHEARYLFVAIK